MYVQCWDSTLLLCCVQGNYFPVKYHYLHGFWWVWAWFPDSQETEVPELCMNSSRGWWGLSHYLMMKQHVVVDGIRTPSERTQLELSWHTGVLLSPASHTLEPVNEAIIAHHKTIFPLHFIMPYKCKSSTKPANSILNWIFPLFGYSKWDMKWGVLAHLSGKYFQVQHTDEIK